MELRLSAKLRQDVSRCATDFLKLSLLAIAASIFAGCRNPSDRIVNDPNGNLHLYITNQSFAVSPVDIKVFIDGELVAKGLFDVGSEHTVRTFVLRLSPGQHKIVAESSKGRAKLEQTLEVNDNLWIALAYWSSQKHERGCRILSRPFLR